MNNTSNILKYIPVVCIIITLVVSYSAYGKYKKNNALNALISAEASSVAEKELKLQELKDYGEYELITPVDAKLDALTDKFRYYKVAGGIDLETSYKTFNPNDAENESLGIAGTGNGILKNLPSAELKIEISEKDKKAELAIPIETVFAGITSSLTVNTNSIIKSVSIGDGTAEITAEVFGDYKKIRR